VRPEQARPLIKGMAEGLAYAHRKGIVHSDFKPANVFITRDGTPKVLDFGIARAVKRAEDVLGGAQVQEDDSILSGYTVAYAAPQAIADLPPDTSDDVFSLGLVAYELLTGKHPFDRLSAEEARQRKASLEPIPGLRRHEWKALEKALAFERADRWPDAGAFLKALQGVTRLQWVLGAAVIVLSIAAAVLWYRNYVASGPEIAFEELPLPQQRLIAAELADGREALKLVKDKHIIDASSDAADQFAQAYSHHVRNRDAVAGLKQSADYFIEWSTAQPDRQLALSQLQEFQKKSEFYQTYAPLNRAIDQLRAH
jgi:serine/threonine protein kinase